MNKDMMEDPMEEVRAAHREKVMREMPLLADAVLFAKECGKSREEIEELFYEALDKECCD